MGFLDGLRLAFGLALAGGLAWWVLRRLGPRIAGPATGPLRVLGRVPLGPRRAIVLVAAGRQAWVVGVSERGFDVIGSMDSSEVDVSEESGIPPEASWTAGLPRSVTGWLDRLGFRGRGKGVGGDG